MGGCHYDKFIKDDCECTCSYTDRTLVSYSYLCCEKSQYTVVFGISILAHTCNKRRISLDIKMQKGG